jgi:hypothetical protein
MKYFVEIKVPETIRKVQQYIECDLCKKHHTNNWKESIYDDVEVEICLRIGRSYPDGGSGENISFDICPDCFNTKLIPWMKSQGVEPEMKEWDW